MKELIIESPLERSMNIIAQGRLSREGNNKHLLFAKTVLIYIPNFAKAAMYYSNE